MEDKKQEQRDYETEAFLIVGELGQALKSITLQAMKNIIEYKDCALEKHKMGDLKIINENLKIIINGNKLTQNGG